MRGEQGVQSNKRLFIVFFGHSFTMNFFLTLPVFLEVSVGLDFLASSFFLQVIGFYSGYNFHLTRLFFKHAIISGSTLFYVE